MAHLLGSQDCVESLRKDLIDLQDTVLDVFSRTGPVRFPSWKFPDKLSCNLDLVSLLDKYDFVDGEDEFNQHTHIVLLELVIDRLLLLLQSFNAYAEQMRIGQRKEQFQQTSPCVSIGLVVRYYWNNLIQLVNQQGTTKDSQKGTKPSKHEEVSPSPAPSVRSCGDFRVLPPFCGRTENTHCVGTPQNQVRGQPFSEASGAAIAHPTPPPVSSDTHSVSCQTVESCLVPCDACARVQASLRETGDSLVELCRTEGLPSSLQLLLGVVDETSAQGRLTAADLAQWATDQRRDMGRLGKHLQEVRATVQPLREGLQAAEGEREGLKAQLLRAQEERQQEREDHRASTQQQQQRLLEVQTSWVETEKRLQEEQEELRRGTVSLEDSKSKLKEDVRLLQERSRILELERDELHEEVTSLRKEKDMRHELEEKMHKLEAQLSSTQLLLDKESAKYQSACRQQESMQAKQGSLLERVDALDQECEELRKQLDEGEDGQTDLQEKLERISEERTGLQAQLIQQQALSSELQEQKQKLEAHVVELTDSVTKLRLEVKELTQRERLLVAFPELSPVPQGPPQSTGDVLRDMEQQLHANSVRIRVLEQENVTLHSTLSKLRPRSQHRNLEAACPQQESLALSHTPAENQQVPSPHAQPSPLQTSSTGVWRCGLSRNEASEPPVVLGPWDHPSTAASSASRSASSSASASSTRAQLQQQTLTLSPGTSAAKTYSRIRHTSQARANAVPEKRK